MKKILILMMFPLLGFGQIDLSGYEITNDSIVTHKDTMIWAFYTDSIGQNNTPIYQAVMTIWRQGQPYQAINSGVLRKRDYRIFLNSHIGNTINERDRLQKEWNTYKDLRNALVAERQGL